MKTKGKRLISILLATIMLISMYAVMFSVSAAVTAISVGSQSATLTAGTGGTVDFTITITADAVDDVDTLTLTWTDGAPTGVTTNSASISSFKAKTTSDQVEISISTTSSTPAGEYEFTIKATTADVSNTGTLIVDPYVPGAPTIAATAQPAVGATSIAITGTGFNTEGSESDFNIGGTAASKVGAATITANRVTFTTDALVVGDRITVQAKDSAFSPAASANSNTVTFTVVDLGEAAIKLDINYIRETVKITGTATSIGGGISYMYALKADDGKQANAKWFPVYGTSINISKYVPKKGTYKIAVKEADDIIKDGKYDTWTTVEIPMRPDIKNFKDQVVYDVATEAFVNKSSEYVEVKVGDGLLGTLSPSDDDIRSVEKVSMDAFPNGASFTYVIKAVNTSGDEEGKFKSLEGKGKVSAQPKAPKISLAEQNANAKKNIVAGWTVKGASSKIEVLVGYMDTLNTDGNPILSEEVWLTLPGTKNLTLQQLKASIKEVIDEKKAEASAYVAKAGEDGQQFESALIKELKKGREDDTDPANIASYMLKFRTAAEGTKPSSAKTVLSILPAQYKIAPTASFEDVLLEDVNVTGDASETIEITLNNGIFKSDLTLLEDIFVDPAKFDVVSIGDTAQVKYELKKKDGSVDFGADGNTVTIIVTVSGAVKEAAKYTLSSTVSGLKIKADAIVDGDSDRVTKDVAVSGKSTVKVIVEAAPAS